MRVLIGPNTCRTPNFQNGYEGVKGQNCLQILKAGDTDIYPAPVPCLPVSVARWRSSRDSSTGVPSMPAVRSTSFRSDLKVAVSKTLRHAAHPYRAVHPVTVQVLEAIFSISQQNSNSWGTQQTGQDITYTLLHILI